MLDLDYPQIAHDVVVIKMLCHKLSDMKYAGAVYEVRTYGSVRGMGHEPHPTRCEAHKMYHSQNLLIKSRFYITGKFLKLNLIV
jgi:hypothetical protein